MVFLTYDCIINDVEADKIVVRLFAESEPAFTLKVPREARVHFDDTIADRESVDAGAGLDNDVDILKPGCQ